MRAIEAIILWMHTMDDSTRPRDHTLDDYRNDFTVTWSQGDSWDQMWLEKQNKWKTIDLSAALPAQVLFHSEKQSIKKEYGWCTLISWHFCGFQASTIRSTQHPVGAACSLSLACRVSRQRQAWSRVVNIKHVWYLCLILVTHRLDQEQLNIVMTPHNKRIFWTKNYLRQASNQATPPERGANRFKIGHKIV